MMKETSCVSGEDSVPGSGESREWSPLVLHTGLHHGRLGKLLGHGSS